MFSSIAQHFNLPTNRLYRERDKRLKSGGKIIDLVSGNVSAQGLQFPPGLLQKAMRGAAKKAQIYHPHSLGQPTARQTISAYYRQEGVKIPPEQILLTPGTSVSYWYAFKLLADTGDEILCPQPSYPLFDSIAALCGVKLVPYRLREEDRWEIDFDQLRSTITDKSRAIILISPHNPTGAVATNQEVKELSEIATQHDLAIIADEVFSPFVYSSSSAGSGGGATTGSPTEALGDDGRTSFPRPATAEAPLVLTLNGLSKMLALPGLKLGWMGVTGCPDRVSKALHVLEMISDTFLPVNEVFQLAVPSLLQPSRHFHKQYRREIQRRRTQALQRLRQIAGISFVPPEGGFYITLRLDSKEWDEERLVCELVEKVGILMHPGYFYDMEGRHVILSFVEEPRALARGLAGFKRYLGRPVPSKIWAP